MSFLEWDIDYGEENCFFPTWLLKGMREDTDITDLHNTVYDIFHNPLENPDMQNNVDYNETLTELFIEKSDSLAFKFKKSLIKSARKKYLKMVYTRINEYREMVENAINDIQENEA